MPAGDENIYVLGFMGAGKSTVGKSLGERLQRPFCDTDVMIARRSGKSIPEIFRENGERFFRELEREVIAEVAEHAGQVVAPGGGSVIEDRNRRIMQASGVSFYLKWPFRILSERILEAPGRPLVKQLRTESRLRELYEQRVPYYEQADHVIACDTCGTPEGIVAEIVRKLEGAI